MIRSLPLFALLVLASPVLAAGVPAHDHVIVVVMENKSYAETVNLPYMTALRATGATLTNSFATAHPSQPNYFSLWAGNTLVTNDNCPAAGSPYPYNNLGLAVQTAGKTWRSYSENLAVVGSTACSYDGTASTGLYTRKHDPWTYFNNITHTNERPYTDLATDIANNALPNLAFVIPNNCHNTHNSTTSGCSINDGDTWLSNNLPQMISAAGPNGLVILTWDEDDSSQSNQILTVFAGGLVLPGSSTHQTVNHYTVVRTICDALGLPPVGAAFSEVPITGIWQDPTPVTRGSWGRLKTVYR